MIEHRVTHLKDEPAPLPAPKAELLIDVIDKKILTVTSQHVEYMQWHQVAGGDGQGYGHVRGRALRTGRRKRMVHAGGGITQPRRHDRDAIALRKSCKRAELSGDKSGSYMAVLIERRQKTAPATPCPINALIQSGREPEIRWIHTDFQPKAGFLNAASGPSSSVVHDENLRHLCAQRRQIRREFHAWMVRHHDRTDLCAGFGRECRWRRQHRPDAVTIKTQPRQIFRSHAPPRHTRSFPPADKLRTREHSAMAAPIAVPAAEEGAIRRGVRLIFMAQVVRLLVRLATAATLARLLDPVAYGLFGMAAAVYGLLYMARDFGIVTALQQPETSRADFHALCRIGVVGGFALAACGAVVALPTGWFFGEPTNVPWVLAAMCTGFIFAAAGAPAMGALYREHQAGRVALIDAAAMTVGSVAAIIGASLGAGVWALVLMGVVGDATSCALAWRACPWRRGATTTEVRWRALAVAGANLTGHNVATYLARTLDQVAVGRLNGAGALGLYGRGAQIPALPTQFGIGPFSPYLVATLGHLHARPVEYTAFFRRALNALLHVSFAGAAVCVAVPELLVRVLFGPQWLAAAPVVRWLGLVLALQPWLSAPLWLLGGAGASRRLLIWSVTGMAMMAIACTLAASAGFAAVAVAAAVAAFLQAAVAPVFCAGLTAVGWRDWLAPAALPAVVHGAAAILLLAAAALLPTPWPGILRAMVLFLILLVYYAAAGLRSARLRAEIRGHMFWSR